MEVRSGSECVFALPIRTVWEGKTKRCIFVYVSVHAVLSVYMFVYLSLCLWILLVHLSCILALFVFLSQVSVPSRDKRLKPKTAVMCLMDVSHN